MRKMLKFVGLENLGNILSQNPGLLEDYVMKYVDIEQLERWLLRKTQKNHKRSLSIARTKVCIESYIQLQTY
jgi:hypothetical protein